MAGTIRRIEDWATRRRGLAVLAVAVGLAGMYVHTVAQRERCEECDELVYPALRYCDACGHETGCDHDAFKEDGPVCPACGEDQ